MLEGSAFRAPGITPGRQGCASSIASLSRFRFCRRRRLFVTIEVVSHPTPDWLSVPDLGSEQTPRLPCSLPPFPGTGGSHGAQCPAALRRRPPGGLIALTLPCHISLAGTLSIGARTRDRQHNLACRRRRVCLGRPMAGREAFCEATRSSRQSNQDGRGETCTNIARGVQPWRRADVHGRRLVPDRGISTRLITFVPLREGRRPAPRAPALSVVLGACPLPVRISIVAVPAV
jgi:hypothetical protein